MRVRHSTGVFTKQRWRGPLGTTRRKKRRVIGFIKEMTKARHADAVAKSIAGCAPTTTQTPGLEAFVNNVYFPFNSPVEGHQRGRNTQRFESTHHHLHARELPASGRDETPRSLRRESENTIVSVTDHCAGT